MPAFSSLDKDQIKVVIDEVTRWLDLAEEGDWMTLPGISGFQAFEVQLVLRQALPNIWTVLRDQGVSSRLGVGSLRGSVSPSASEKGSLSSSPALLL